MVYVMHRVRRSAARPSGRLGVHRDLHLNRCERTICGASERPMMSMIISAWLMLAVYNGMRAFGPDSPTDLFVDHEALCCFQFDTIAYMCDVD